MFCVRNLWLIAAVVAVTAYSARAVYEELDQDMPYIVWPTMLLQWAAYAMMAYAIYASTNGVSPWLLGGALLFLVAHSIVETWYLLDSALWTQMLLLIGVMGYAGAILLSAPMSLNRMVPVLIGAVTIIVAHTVIVPAEEDRRLAAGPGMALLMLGWLLLGMYAMGGQTALPIPAPPLDAELFAAAPIPAPPIDTAPFPESPFEASAFPAAPFSPESPLPPNPFTAAATAASPLPAAPFSPESVLPSELPVTRQMPVRRQFSLMQ